MFFTGSLLIEILFSLDGLGLLGYEAAIRRDYPVVLGTLYLFTLIGLVIEADQRPDATCWVDPRVEFVSPRRRRSLACRCRRRARRAPGGASAPTGSATGRSGRSSPRCSSLSLFAELIANDRPLLVRYDGAFYFPIVRDYPETTFGGDFATPGRLPRPESSAKRSTPRAGCCGR